MEDGRVTLISKWKLRNGFPDELRGKLKKLADKVKKEQGTLMYLVNIQTCAPLDSYHKPIKPQPEPILPELQSEVVFMEIYENAEAFSRHVNGETFNEFRKNTLKYFQADPINAGWPITETEFFSLQSGFIKKGILAEVPV
jgi:quinol monooxygenase YgiN